MKGEQSSAKVGMEELLSMHHDEVAVFRNAFKDATDALRAISQAIVVMAKFYKQDKIPLQPCEKNNGGPSKRRWILQVHH